MVRSGSSLTEKRLQVVRLTLTVEEKERLEAAARAASLPVAVWVRMVALASAPEAR